MSNREFPERGIIWKELWEARARDPDWSSEIMDGVTWPNPGGNVHLAAYLGSLAEVVAEVRAGRRAARGVEQVYA